MYLINVEDNSLSQCTESRFKSFADNRDDVFGITTMLAKANRQFTVFNCDTAMFICPSGLGFDNDGEYRFRWHMPYTESYIFKCYELDHGGEAPARAVLEVIDDMSGIIFIEGYDAIYIDNSDGLLTAIIHTEVPHEITDNSCVVVGDIIRNTDYMVVCRNKP